MNKISISVTVLLTELCVTAGAAAHVGITSPQRYSTVEPGTRVELKWTIQDHGAGTFDVEFSPDGSAAFSAVERNIAKTDSGPFRYLWRVPNVSCELCRVRVTMRAGGSSWEDVVPLSIGSASAPPNSAGGSQASTIEEGAGDAAATDDEAGGCSVSSTAGSGRPWSVVFVVLGAGELWRRRRRPIRTAC
jgi:MYXO-CTERM domain-containing protein